MKKLLLFSSVVLVVMSTLMGCNKSEFGTKETDFEVGSVYQADSDGLLTIHYKTSSFGLDSWVKIYLDQSSDPSTLHSEMSVTSSSTFSVHKNDYWKVVVGPNGSARIEFTPFE